MGREIQLGRFKPYLLFLVLVAIWVYLERHGKENGSTTQSQAERQAISTCAKLVRERAVFPSSVDIHFVTGAGSDLGGDGGKPRVAFNFDAKNGLGNMLPYLAYCDFSTDPPQVTISNR